MKPAVIDSHEWNELLIVVLDEQNVTIADFKFGCVGDFHRFITNRAPEHPNCVSRTGITFYILRDLKGDIRVNVALGSLSFPNRAHVSHRALKNKFSLLNQLIKGRRNHSCGGDAEKSGTDPDEREKKFYFTSFKKSD